MSESRSIAAVAAALAFALHLVVLLAGCEDDPSTLLSGANRRSVETQEPADEGGTSTDPPIGDDASASDAGSAAAVDGGKADAGPKDAGTSPQEICVSIINEYRATVGAPPLVRWPAAEACADNQAKSDGAMNKPHGAFPGCGESGQNECLGISSPANIRPCLAAMWAEGPGGGHYENMRATRFTQVACGFGAVGAGYWAVQDFR